MTVSASDTAEMRGRARGLGPRRWGRVPSIALLLGLAASMLGGCSDTEETRTLSATQVALTAEDEPIYDDGELSLYESKTEVPLPILAPTEDQAGELWRNPTDPFPHNPWLEVDDLKVQLTWTISNLDAEAHNVELLVDPWNEFGRYWPGLTLVDSEDGEFLPNLSGFDDFIEVPGTSAGSASRVTGTVTFNDTREMATDFATVMYLIAHPPEGIDGFDDADPLASLANHAFHVLNRSEDDPLIAPYIPAVIPGITGFDVGLRTYEPANVALEVVVEVVDLGGSSPVASEDDEKEQHPMLWIPDTYITVGSGP